MVEEFASNPESFVMAPKAMSDHCFSNSSCFKRCARINPLLLLSRSTRKRHAVVAVHSWLVSLGYVGVLL